MKRSSPFIFVLALVVMAGLGIGVFTLVNRPASKSADTPPAKPLSTSPTPSGEATALASPQTYRGGVLAGTTAPLIDYNRDDYDLAIKSDKLVVLYFYASWCPVCMEEQPHLRGAFNDLTTDRVVGFRVNYKDDDTDKDEENLARQYGIAYQHTKVFVKNGERVLKSAPELWTKERYLDEINKYL